jgi:hypothetical protein
MNDIGIATDVSSRVVTAAAAAAAAAAIRWISPAMVCLVLNHDGFHEKGHMDTIYILYTV